jgi:hypothetical protein
MDNEADPTVDDKSNEYLNVFKLIEKKDNDYIVETLKKINKGCYLLDEKFDGFNVSKYAYDRITCFRITRWKIKQQNGLKLSKRNGNVAKAILGAEPIQFVYTWADKKKQLSDYQYYANNLRLELKKYKIHIAKKHDLVNNIKHEFFTEGENYDVYILKSIIATYVKLNELYLRYHRTNPDPRIVHNGFSKLAKFWDQDFIKEIAKITGKSLRDYDLSFTGYNAINNTPDNILGILRDIHSIPDEKIEDLKKLLNVIDIKTILIIVTEYLKPIAEFVEPGEVDYSRQIDIIQKIKDALTNKQKLLQTGFNAEWASFSSIVDDASIVDDEWWLKPINNEWRFSTIDSSLRLLNSETEKVKKMLKFKPIDEVSLLNSIGALTLTEDDKNKLSLKIKEVLSAPPEDSLTPGDERKENKVMIDKKSLSVIIEKSGITVNKNKLLIELNELLGLDSQDSEWDDEVETYFRTIEENTKEINNIKGIHSESDKVNEQLQLKTQGGVHKTLKQKNNKKRKSHKNKRMPYKTYRKVNQKRKTRKYVR